MFSSTAISSHFKSTTRTLWYMKRNNYVIMNEMRVCRPNTHCHLINVQWILICFGSDSSDNSRLFCQMNSSLANFIVQWRSNINTMMPLVQQEKIVWHVHMYFMPVKWDRKLTKAAVAFFKFAFLALLQRHIFLFILLIYIIFYFPLSLHLFSISDSEIDKVTHFTCISFFLDIYKKKISLWHILPVPSFLNIAV